MSEHEFKWNDSPEQLGKFIREIVIPRLHKLEEEVYLLRKHTWPYVQAKKEVNHMADLYAKREFLHILDDDQVRELLNIKSKHSKTGGGMQLLEYDALHKLKNNLC